MRPIKYRAYIKRANIMVGVRAINFEKEFILTSSWTRYEFSDIELMQYTWFKDTNDREIYEGDIILSDTWRYKWVVEYNDGIASFVLVKEWKSDYLWEYIVRAVYTSAIANIHEIPN